jgi:hypothetical protein
MKPTDCVRLTAVSKGSNPVPELAHSRRARSLAVAHSGLNSRQRITFAVPIFHSSSFEQRSISFCKINPQTVATPPARSERVGEHNLVDVLVADAVVVLADAFGVPAA